MSKTALAVFLILTVEVFVNIAFAESLSIRSEPIRQLKPGSDKTRFQNLEFLGGLVLTSDHEDFGGLSGMRFTDEENLVLITDKARVVSAKIKRENGRPVGLTNASLTRIKRADGKTITGAEDKDSEALEIAGSSYFVGYERNDRLLRFTMKNKTLFADAGYVVDFNHLQFPNNKGPEAIAIHPNSQKLYLFAEHARNEDGDHRGFVISRGKIERELSVRYTGRYSLTDAAFLPSGDLLLLERYYNPFTRTYVRIRKISDTTLEQDTLLDGAILLELNSDHEIDNMEGLAISTMPDGAQRITLVSDDNFSNDQRTILLEFKLD